MESGEGPPSNVNLRATGRRRKDSLLEYVKIQTALDRYGQGSITLLKAAEVAGVSIYEMIGILEERRIPYRYDISDLKEYVKRRYR